jgi:hypothetical protein
MNKKNFLSILEKISILILFMVFISPFFYSFTVSSSFLYSILIRYYKLSEVIFGITNIIVLIEIYKYFVKEENQKDKQGKFILKNINKISDLLEEVYSTDIAEINQIKKVRLCLSRISFSLKRFNEIPEIKKIEGFSDLFDSFEEFETSYLDLDISKHQMHELAIKKEVNVILKKVFYFESKVLEFNN